MWIIRSIVSGYKPTECSSLEAARLIVKWNYMHDYEIVNKFTGEVFERFQRFTGREIPKCPRCQKPAEDSCLMPKIEVSDTQEYRCPHCEDPENKKEPVKIFKVRTVAHFTHTVVEESVQSLGNQRKVGASKSNLKGNALPK